MYDEFGIKPITEKFLERNHLFALAFNEGWIFGRVLLAEKKFFKPYALINSAGTAQDIAASSGITELRIYDPRNRDTRLLYLDDATTPDTKGVAGPGFRTGLPTILHGAIGLKPSHIRMYVRYPWGKSHFGEFEGLNPISATSSGNYLGYVDGVYSPYEMPTDWLEMWIPPKMDISVEFYNQDVKIHQPVLNLMFNQYHFMPLSANNPNHSRVIKLIANRQIPAAFGQCGPTRGLKTFDFSNDWRVTPLSLDEAMTL
jgi:hypothetical protein